MRQKLTTLTKQEAEQRYQALDEIRQRIGEKNLQLDLSRGKPSMEQLDMVSEIMVDNPLISFMAEDGTDTRNYGSPDGIPEARRLMAELMDCDPEKVIVYGESSLELMYTAFARAKLFALPDADHPWGMEETIHVLCPTPGYDRHFAISEALGAKNIPVRMTPEGPDMDQVEQLLRDDRAIKAMFIVPLYSNPTGYSLSAETCRRLAEMDAPDDFIIIYDNAYGAHPVLDEEPPSLPDFLRLCEEAGHPNRPIVFASTSKMTYASAGMAAIAMNEPLRSWWKDKQASQTIGPNKVNQLMHTEAIRSAGGIRALMRRHQQMLAPRFSLVLDILEERLDGLGIATWTNGAGGYFITVDLLPGTAKRAIELAAEVGVQLTPAGSTWPYGEDPLDSNLRLAPSYPEFDELRPAMEVFCLAAELAALELHINTQDSE